MSLSSTVAKQLCTKAELKLFTESLSRNVRNLDAKALKTRITRARKLRDKYSSLAKQQEREIRRKQEQRRRRAVTANVNTRRKERLFSETLTRFEKYQSSLKTSPGKAVKKPTKKRAKVAAAGKKKVAAKATRAPKKGSKAPRVSAATATERHDPPVVAFRFPVRGDNRR